MKKKKLSYWMAGVVAKVRNLLQQSATAEHELPGHLTRVLSNLQMTMFSNTAKPKVGGCWLLVALVRNIELVYTYQITSPSNEL